MDFFVALANGIMPWVCGSAVTCGLAANYGWSRIETAVGCSCSLIVSLAALVALIWYFPSLSGTSTGIAPVTSIFAAVTAICLASVWGLGSEKRKLCIIATSRGTAGIAFLASFIYFVVASMADTPFPPLAGWDLIDHWGIFATHFIQLSEPSALTFMDVEKHPATVPLLFAWAASCFPETGSLALGVYFLSLQILIAAIMSIICYARHRRLGLRLAIFLCIATCSVPLIENHVMQPGYVDSLVGQVLLIGCVASVLAFDIKLRGLFVLGLFCLATPIFLKNIGYVVSILSICVLASTILKLRRRLMRLIWLEKIRFFLFPLLATTGIFVLILTVYGWDVSIFGIRNGYYPEQGLFVIGGRYMYWGEAGISSIISAELHSKFFNVSFQLCFFILILALLEEYKDLYNAATPKNDSDRFPLIFLLFLWALMLLSLFFDQGYQFAVPGNDTGYSRFTLFYVWLFPLIAADLLSKLSRTEGESGV